MYIHRCHAILFFLSLSVYGEVSDVGFTESPYSMMVTVGTRATFRCRHETADVIGWRVNGTSIGQVGNPDFIPGTIRRGDGSLVHILTVVVHPEYNDTVITCVAAFLRQEVPLELSPPVTLTVFEGCNETCIYEGFLEVPQSTVVAIETEAIFTCRHVSTDRVFWIINGTTSLDESCLSNITTSSDSLLDGDITYSLTISGLATYNGTYVQCAAYVEVQPDRSIPATLLIQGPLGAISGVFRDNLANHMGVSYLWEPPSTLDLTGVEPDIVFCVEVSNITCGADNLVASDCEVMNPVYPSSVGGGLDPSYVYEITVTPRSNVLGAINGSAFITQEEFMSVEAFPTAVVESVPGVLIEFGVFVNDTESERLVRARARSYSIEIVSVDGSEIVSESFGESRERVAMLLSKRKQWTSTIFAYGCQLHPVSITKEISTFAIQNVSMSSGAPGELHVTASFLTNTSAVGMLAIVYSTENVSDIHYTETRLPQTEIHLTGLSGSAYSTSVFDIENSGLPFNKAATLPMSINITQGVSPVSAPVSTYYQVQNISTGVCITCTFLESSTTDCVAVVHPRISQLNSSGLMIIMSYNFNRSGDDTAYGCIEGVNLTSHQIGVIGARLILIESDVSIPTLNTPVYVATLVASWIFMIFVYLPSIILICRYLVIKKRKKKQEPENDTMLSELKNLKSSSESKLKTVSEYTNVADELECSRQDRTKDCDTSNEHSSIVNVDIVPEVETSVGYEGTSALDVCDLPRDIPSNDRLCTQPRSALRRNMPTSNLEPDPHFLSQSLKPQVHISNPLSYEDADRCRYSTHLTPESEFPGPVECAEVTEAHQATDMRTPSNKEYVYVYHGSKFSSEERQHEALPRSFSNEMCTKMTTATQERGTYILGLVCGTEENIDSDCGLRTSQVKILSDQVQDPQRHNSEDSYPEEYSEL